MKTPTAEQTAHRATVEAAIAYLNSVGLTPFRIHAAAIALDEAEAVEEERKTDPDAATVEESLETMMDDSDSCREEGWECWRGALDEARAMGL